MKREYLNSLSETGDHFRIHFINNYYKTYKHQMTFLQSLVFGYLVENEDATAKELSRNFELPKQHISNIIKKFENEGFIEKRPGKDKRYSIINITEAGKQEYYRHLSECEEHSISLLEQMDDVDDFFLHLKKVNYYLRQIGK